MMTNVRGLLSAADDLTIKSSSRMMNSIKNGSMKKHNITDNAIPFSEKENHHLHGFSRMLKTKNYGYVLECR